MAKKKKPAIDPKVQQAQYKNNYLREFKKYANQIHPDLYPRLSNLDLEGIFMSRGTVVRSVGDGSRLPAWMTRSCDEFIRHHMRALTINVVPGSFTVNLIEYATYIIPLEGWSVELETKFEDCPWFKEIILDKSSERMNKYESFMNYISIFLMTHLSNPAYQLCNVRYCLQDDCTAEGFPRISQHFKVRGCNPAEYRLLYKTKDRRTAVELAYNYPHLLNPKEIPPFTQVKLPPSHFGIETGGENEKPYPVFILRHALNRLNERIGCLVAGYAGAQIIESLLQPKVHHVSKDGSLLVEYHIEGAKAGYLHLDMSEEVILIRTFLFLTNASTPEGIRLRTHLGLQKADIKVFDLDKLTPLMESDLITDENMCKKLRQANCESLIDLYKAVKNSKYWEHTEEQKQVAAKLRKYMMEENVSPNDTNK